MSTKGRSPPPPPSSLQLRDGLRPTFGAVHRLYTADGTRVKSLDQIEHDKVRGGGTRPDIACSEHRLNTLPPPSGPMLQMKPYVIAGKTGPFVPFAYDEILDPKSRAEKLKRPDPVGRPDAPPTHRSSPVSHHPLPLFL